MTPAAWLAIWAAHAALEYWLGRTGRVKAGSAVELVLQGASYAMNFFK